MGDVPVDRPRLPVRGRPELENGDPEDTVPEGNPVGAVPVENRGNVPE